MQRDRHATQPVEFVFTHDQLATFTAWLDSTLVRAGAWFAANWPQPAGGSGVRRFVGEPSYPVYQPSRGWRVSAVCEVRGRGMPPREAGVPWQPVLRDGMFRYSLIDDFDIADPGFDETTLTEAQGTFGDVNPHPFNGPAWPVNTLTPDPGLGDVIWVRKTTNLSDFISTWHVHIVNDNTVRVWFNGIEIAVLAPPPGVFETLLDVTPVYGDNVFVIRVIDTQAANPLNKSQAGFEITR
jgi:hypothetical protein